jgi:hypothetical protein
MFCRIRFYPRQRKSQSHAVELQADFLRGRRVVHLLENVHLLALKRSRGAKATYLGGPVQPLPGSTTLSPTAQEQFPCNYGYTNTLGPDLSVAEKKPRPPAPVGDQLPPH